MKFVLLPKYLNFKNENLIRIYISFLSSEQKNYEWKCYKEALEQL